MPIQLEAVDSLAEKAVSYQKKEIVNLMDRSPVHNGLFQSRVPVMLGLDNCEFPVRPVLADQTDRKGAAPNELRVLYCLVLTVD